MNNNFEKNISAYDKKAADYDNTHDGKFTEKFKSFLLKTVSIKDGDFVLDVGCGNGSLLTRISKVKAIHGFGTDISPQMIKNASWRNPHSTFVTANCENIPFDDKSMDIIITCAAYHHFPDVNAFAKEVKRLLTRNGDLYVAEINLPPLIRHIANVFLPLSKDGDVKFYSTNEIVSTFSSVGFRYEGVSKSGHIQIVHMKNE